MSDPSEPAGRTASSVFPEAPRAQLRAQFRPAILSVLVLTLLTGCVFPLLLFAIGRPLFPRQAGGSLLTRGAATIGSELIGQQFTRPEYFQSRPSAAGNGYDGTSSGGTNLGPNNPKLRDGAADFAGIRQLAEDYRKRNGLAARRTNSYRCGDPFRKWPGSRHHTGERGASSSARGACAWPE